jgi:dCTP diphosphatase
MDIQKIQTLLEEFANDRDWNQFHSPKNLIMALSSEVGELNDIFQWLTEEQSKKENISDANLDLTKEELADIMIYLLRLCDKLDVNIEKEVLNKIELNKEKYSIESSKGNALKYNRRDE